MQLAGSVCLGGPPVTETNPMAIQIRTLYTVAETTGPAISREDELLWAIENLLEDGEIDSGTPAYAVACKAAREGRTALTLWERGIFDRQIKPILSRRAEAAAKAVA